MLVYQLLDCVELIALDEMDAGTDHRAMYEIRRVAVRDQEDVAAALAVLSVADEVAFDLGQLEVW
ncbi:hypothetical protein ACU8M5_10845 [Rhizobium leguminosarum]